MVLFGRASFLTGVIVAQSQQRAEKVGASSKIGDVKKQEHKVSYRCSLPSPLHYGLSPIEKGDIENFKFKAMLHIQL